MSITLLEYFENVKYIYAATTLERTISKNSLLKLNNSTEDPIPRL